MPKGYWLLPSSLLLSFEQINPKSFFIIHLLHLHALFIISLKQHIVEL